VLRAALLSLFVLALAAMPSVAQDDARMKQLRLLCAQLSGDLTDPGGMAAFRRCLTTHDPLGEIKRNNGLGGRPVPRVVDRPNAKPPHGYGADSRKLAAEGIHGFTTLDGRLFYGVDKDGTVWRWDVTTKKADAIDRNVVGVMLIDATHLMVLDKANVLWREDDNGGSRVGIDRAVAHVQAISPDLIYVLSQDGQLWRNRVGGQRTLVDRRVKGFQALDADTVYVLGIDGVLWRETGDAHNGKQLAQHIEDFHYLPDGDTLYVIAADATLWRQSGKNAEQIDKDVAAFQVIDMHLAYVLGKDGRLWKELGSRDKAVLVDRGVMVSGGAFLALDARRVVVLTGDHKLWNETMP
jgi:hypothetical protein